MKKLKAIFKKKQIWLFIVIVTTIVCTSVYHSYKDLPEGISIESQTYMVEDVQFLYDLSYKGPHGIMYDQHIFEGIHELIRQAEDYIVIDMFLFNEYIDKGEFYPQISGELTKAIVKQIEKKPNLSVHLLTDEINTSYNSHQVGLFETLKRHGVHVTLTNLEELRDPNPIYSGLWRVGLQWFGQEGNGWLANPLADSAPEVTARSYYKLLNLKANHRKVIVTEDAAIISSANAHNASGYHSNIAFKVTGNIIGDVLESEQAVAGFSGYDTLPKWKKQQPENGEVAIQLVTEGKIKKNAIEAIQSAEEGETIWIAMFYLADTDILETLKAAAKEDVRIHLILDPNQNAFGSEKIGLPNLPVAAELTKLTQDNLKIRWYNTGKEQFHSKLLYVQKEDKSIIIGGSANYTERNLADYNLETNLKIIAPNDSEIVTEVQGYFERLWTNNGGEYTVDYKEYKDDLPIFKYILYLIQKLFKFTTY